MKYLRRKLYALITLTLWAMILHRFILILLNATPLDNLLSISMPYDPHKATSELYWIVPVWLIAFIFWQMAPTPAPRVGGKLTRKQKAAMMQAMSENLHDK